MKISIRYACFVSVILGFLVHIAEAQGVKDFSILLRSGSFEPEKNVFPAGGSRLSLTGRSAQSSSFVLIQFESIPGERERKELRNAGIELLDYIPNYAYTAVITGPLNQDVLAANKGRAVVELSAQQKMEPALAGGKLPVHATSVNGTVDVWISYPRTFSFDRMTSELKDREIEVISDELRDYEVLSLRIATTRLSELALLPFIQYVQLVPVPEEPLNDKSVVNSRANVLASALPGRTGLLGKGVVVGVGDNAYPLQHIDFNGRMINRSSSLDGGHGIHVMGTVGGAGIVNERYSGYAPKATIVAQYFGGIFKFASAYVKDYGMVITNNSYGGDVNNCGTFGIYDLNSYILDRQAFQLPYLQHVFAAGNSGSTACSPYPTGFSNVLGGFQTAKNVISVGNTTDGGIIAASSSKGPVRDGRIKPEITAQGTSVMSTYPLHDYKIGNGTSFSSPAVAGGLALLYERFRQLNQNKNPKNALMKALICNGGTDQGNEGPDFKYGFGTMNLLRSLKMMEANAYRNDSLANGESKTFQINVPANTAQLKVMLYWNDPAAVALSSQNLVNDLDVMVTSPLSLVTLPKLLDPTPLNVNSAATTGVDRVNNIEQAVIDYPGEGVYTITVKGASVGQNPLQEFYVVYDAVPISTTLTYPLGKEHLKDSDVLNVTWDSYGNTSSTFTVQFLGGNGTQWVNIGSDLPANTRRLSWTIPAGTTTDKAKIKVIQNNSGLESVSEEFTILGVPAVTLAAVQCESYIAVDWTTVPGATDYEVMILKGDEMVPAGITASNSYVFNNMSKDTTYWVSVRARLNGNPGLRAFAVSRKPDNGTCAGSISDVDLKIESILSPAASGRKNISKEFTSTSSIKIRIRNLDNANSTGSFKVGCAVNGVSIPDQTVTQTILANGSIDYTFSGTFDLSQTRDYEIKISLSKANDPVGGNNVLTKIFSYVDNEAVSLPFFDDMESLPEQTFTANQIGLTGASRYDFSTSSDAGRIRTFVNSDIAFSGSKAITLDANRYAADGVTNYLNCTFNMSAYDVTADDIRLDFRFKNHGQKANASNKVWIKGKDADAWIEVYDLFANQTLPLEAYKLASGIEVSRLIAAGGKNFSTTFQIRWGQWGQLIAADRESGAGYTFDDIKLYKAIDDIQAVSINYPSVEGCALGTAESISIKIRNSSSRTITNIPVVYKLQNGTEVTEVIASIAGRTNRDYIFATKADLSVLGTQSIKVWVALETDNYKLNDTMRIDLFNSPVITSFPYLQNFEDGTGYWYTTGTNGSWEYGTPAALKVKRAASGTKSWKTKLAGIYNNNEESYLYSPCFAVSAMSAPTLSFSVALDFELCATKACDIAYLEYSGNGGAWTRLGATGQGTNWYNVNYETKGSWSILDYTRWHVATIPLPAGFSSLKLRFVMKTDGAVQFEGIAIDDIHVYNRVNGIYDETTLSTPLSQNVSNGSDWVNFTKNNKLIASVNSNDQNLGITEVQAYIYSGPVRNVNDQSYLNRNITIKPAVAGVEKPASVRIYFLDSEIEALISAASCTTCSKPGSVYELGISKYNHIDKTREDGDHANSTGGSWSFHDASKINIVPFDKGYYAELQIKDFSEFWFSKNTLAISSALPVELISFTANKKSGDDHDKDVILEWGTSAEVNFDRFVAEVAVGDENYRLSRFTKIGEIQGLGSGRSDRKYVFTDQEKNKAGTHYYRLKMIDLDQQFQYSRVRSVTFDETTEWLVYPNPSGAIFNVELGTGVAEKVRMKIYGGNGRMYFESSLPSQGPGQKHQLDLSRSGIPPGFYFLEVSAGRDIRTFKIVKE